MNLTYQIVLGLDKNPVNMVLCHQKGFIPFDPANTDYQTYLAWLEAGNTPEPAEEQQ